MEHSRTHAAAALRLLPALRGSVPPRPWPVRSPQSLSSTAPRIVALGGGTGLPAVLRGLAASTAIPGLADHLTAIVAVTDDGGSSGVLRKELGILPPGDVRNCLAALIDRPSTVPDLLQHRFAAHDGFPGHPLGNLLLAAMTELTGDFPGAITLLAEVLAVRGRVLPATGEDVVLRAEFTDGTAVEGETAIVARRAPIRRLSLSRPARPLLPALHALAEADMIVLGPGSLYTSLLPSLLVEGVVDEIASAPAVRVLVANLMTEPGETEGFSIDDHLHVLREHVGQDLFDYAIVNSRPLPPDLARQYASRGSLPIPHLPGTRLIGRTRIVEYDLAAAIEGGKIRHAPADLAAALLDLYGLVRRQTAEQAVSYGKGRG